MKSYRFYSWVTICLIVVTFIEVKGQNPAYEQRRNRYIDTCLNHFTPDAITLQAYKGVAVDSIALRTLLDRIPLTETSDFGIVKLIRVLYFSNGAYDSVILPVLNSIPFWLTKSDTLRCYWSENHMCMWMSSLWLLHERYGNPIDTNLDRRLRHFLRMKIQYGFYEFFSSVYAPYCLSGLLNLADFSQDTEIKNLAALAARRLLKDLLMLTNDRGVFFPAAGRNYYGKYENPYGQNHNNLIWLLTGMGDMPHGASHSGGFLASSSLSVDSVILSWKPVLDTLYRVGHSLDSGFTLNRNMEHTDRIIFQWSSGAYFHPSVSLETAILLRDSNLWKHPNFEALRMLSFMPVETIHDLTVQFPAISMSSVICGQDLAIFKHHSITLSSVQDFWKGKLGYQQIPCAANIASTAVFTASGYVEPVWDDRSESNENEHLPYVKQVKNVALMMYRPEPKPAFLNFSHPEVALHWTDTDFDESTEDSLWIIGRKDENYVAVRRGCMGTENGIRTCMNPDRQAWAVVVGDSGMYGNFTNFQSLIHTSQFTERSYLDTLSSQSVYYARIDFDTITIEYAWGVDTVSTHGINENQAQNGLNIFPNPADEVVEIDLADFQNMDINIIATDMSGRSVYCRRMRNVSAFSVPINTSSWRNGLYYISVSSSERVLGRKLVIE